MRSLTTSSILMAFALNAAGCGRVTDVAAPAETAAAPLVTGHFRQASLRNAAGQDVGRVTWVRAGGTRVAVVATINFPGARAGFHGIHVHANDNPANGQGCVADPAAPANTHFVSVDGHYNPASTTHGAHGGDMPNVSVLDDGAALLNFLTEVDLDDLAGRAVILHEGVDNHGHVPVGTAPNQYTANAPDALTLTANTGNAGNRIACGVIR